MRLAGGVFLLLTLAACPDQALADKCMPGADNAASAVKDWRTLHEAFANGIIATTV